MVANDKQAGLKRHLELVTDPTHAMPTTEMDSLSGHPATSRPDTAWMGGIGVQQSKQTGQVCVEMGMRSQPAIFGELWTQGYFLYLPKPDENETSLTF